MGNQRLVLSLSVGALFVCGSASPTDAWTLISPSRTYVSFLIRNEDTLFAGTSRGYFRLNPAAAGWIQHKGDAPTTVGQPIALNVPFDTRGNTPRLLMDSTPVIAVDSSLYRFRYNGLQWVPEQLADPGIGTLQQLFLHGSTLLASGPNSIARSLDGGRTWSRPALPAGIPTFTSFCARGDTLYAGVAVPSPTPLGGLFRSLDRGLTWTRLQTPKAAQPMVQLPASRKGPLILVMGDSLYVSTNGGGAWRERGPALLRGGGPNLHVGYDGSTLFVRSRNAYAVSRDAGSSWTNRTLPDSLSATYFNAMRDMATTQAALWFKHNMSLYTSKDLGLTWTKAGGIPLVVIILQAEGNSLLIGNHSGRPVWSLDEGATWKGYDEKRLAKTAVRQGNQVWAGTVAGVFRSADGGSTWGPDGLDTMEIEELSLRGTGPGLLAGTSRGLFAKDPSRGEAWHRIMPQAGWTTKASGDGDVVVARAGTGWYFSWDGGLSSLYHREWGIEKQDSSFRNAKAFHSRIWATSLGRLWEMRARGGSLERVPQLLDQESGLPAALDWDTTFYQTLLAGSPNFLLGTKHGLYLSGDSGKTWQNSDSPLWEADIPHLVRMGNRIAAITYRGTWMSADGGRNWEKTDTAMRLGSYSDISLRASEAMAAMVAHGELNRELLILSRDGEWSAGTLPKSEGPYPARIHVVGSTLLLEWNRRVYRSMDKGATWTDLQSICSERSYGMVGKVFLALGTPGPCGSGSGASLALLLSRDTGRTFQPLDPGVLTPAPARQPYANQWVDGVFLMQRDSVLHGTWDGIAWKSWKGRLGGGIFAATESRLYRADLAGIHVLPLRDGPLPVGEARLVAPRPSPSPRIALSRFETMTSALYFPFRGRFTLTAIDVQGRGHRVRTGIPAEEPGVQRVEWKAAAPGRYVLRLTPE